jgi:hypothetical protein
VIHSVISKEPFSFDVISFEQIDYIITRGSFSLFCEKSALKEEVYLDGLREEEQKRYDDEPPADSE